MVFDTLIARRLFSLKEKRKQGKHTLTIIIFTSLHYCRVAEMFRHFSKDFGPSARCGEKKRFCSRPVSRLQVRELLVLVVALAVGLGVLEYLLAPQLEHWGQMLSERCGLRRYILSLKHFQTRYIVIKTLPDSIYFH